MTKRVAASAMNLFEASQEDDNPEVLIANLNEEKLIVANQTEELRVIDIETHGVKMVATIDNGSQIVSIQEDMWENVGLPIRSDKIMVMESANKTKNETMGLLQDLK